MVKRKIEVSDIIIPPGFKVEVFKTGLTTPTNLVVLENGDMYIGESGIIDGNGKLLKLTNDGFEIIADGFNPPLTGITYYNESFYVAHKGKVTKVTNRIKVDIISGLPSYGDYQNNRIAFDNNGKMYFGLGTATNSGVVGIDNISWVKDYPYFHDYPGEFITLNEVNFTTRNFLSSNESDLTSTGAYNPFRIPSKDSEIVKEHVFASGSIIKANDDGTDIELVAWGLKNPFVVKFDKYNRLFTTNHGMDIRGSRPIANAPDEFYQVACDMWYGWPDYSGGYPVILPHFKPNKTKQPQFLLKYHPMLPPKPLSTFTPNSTIMGFDFCYNKEFCEFGDVFIALFGDKTKNVGINISTINLNTGKINIFAKNKSNLSVNNGGFKRPIDVVFHNNDLYVVDYGTLENEEDNIFKMETGVIWKITKE